MYQLNNSAYNYWTPNKQNGYDPATASLPVNNASSLPKFSQIFPAAGWRDSSAYFVDYQGYDGFFWPSTPASSASGYNLLVYSAAVSPVHTYAHSLGISIRCVRI
jgi:hypothetical protein